MPRKKTTLKGDCRCCNRHMILYPYRLCKTCYYTSHLRDQYKTTPNNYLRLLREPKDLPKPTRVLPGPGKVKVLAFRYQRGEMLWHPDDAKGVTVPDRTQPNGDEIPAVHRICLEEKIPE